MLTLIAELMSGETAMSPSGPVDIDTALDGDAAMWGCRADAGAIPSREDVADAEVAGVAEPVVAGV